MISRTSLLFILIIAVAQSSPVRKPETRIGQLIHEPDWMDIEEQPVEVPKRVTYNYEDIVESTERRTGKPFTKEQKNDTNQEYIHIITWYLFVIAFFIIWYHTAFKEVVKLIVRRRNEIAEENELPFTRLPENDI